jgi:cytochrome P450
MSYFQRGGADTTSIGMRSCLYYICSYSEAYAKVQKEVDEFYGQNYLQQPISYTQTLQLPYLRAAVSQALRLLPSIVFRLLRYSPKEGITVDGHYIPPGYENPVLEYKNKLNLDP